MNANHITPANVGGGNQGPALIERLFVSGSISADEREALLAQIDSSQVADRKAGLRRAETADCIHTTLNNGEIMDARQILNQIDQTRAVMGRQLQELSKLSLKPSTTTAARASQDGFEDLLQAAVSQHLGAAAEALNALARVEADMRTPAPKPNTLNPIDVEFHEVK